MSRWNNYFKKELNKHESWIEFVRESWSFNRPLVKIIENLVPKEGNIVELGCGSALISILLDGLGYKVTGVEKDKSVIGFARQNAEKLGSDIRIVEKDLFNFYPEKKFDLAFSVGVIEHFNNGDLFEALKAHSRCGKYVVMVIPTKYSSNLTDERLYSQKYLRKICNQAELKVIDTFAYGNVNFRNELEAGFFCYLLPPLVYKFIQKRFGYATGIGVISKS